MRPNAVGLPGLTAMPWKITSPRSPQDVQDEIALADGTAPRENQDVCIRRRVDGCREVLEVVGSGAEGNRQSAVLANHRR